MATQLEMSGQIIVLNGTSSAGKTTIATILQNLLVEPYFYAPVDLFLDAYPDRFWERERESVRRLHKVAVTGFYRSVLALARAGSNVIVDDVIDLPWMLHECVSTLAPEEPLFVGVYCSPDELDRRERERGDRQVGMARNQLPRVHAHGMYDLTVDTTTTSERECALQIESAIRSAPRNAFRTLLERQNIEG
jgi:chloramphenicol 3-O phosphotransferase